MAALTIETSNGELHGALHGTGTPPPTGQRAAALAECRKKHKKHHNKKKFKRCTKKAKKVPV